MRKLFVKYLGRFAGANLASFLLFYTSSYVLMNDAFEYYVRYFIGEAFEFILPVVAAMVVSSAIAEHGFGALWLAPIISLGRFLYLYPYFYLYFSEGNLLTSEAALISLPISLAAVLVDCLVVCLITFAIYLVTDTLAKKRGRCFADSVRSATSPFDFSEEYSVALFFAAAGIFLVNLVIEIIDTASYLLECSGSYRTEEIIYIVVSFIMIVAELLLCQFIAIKFNEMRIKNNDN